MVGMWQACQTCPLGGHPLLVSGFIDSFRNLIESQDLGCKPGSFAELASCPPEASSLGEGSVCQRPRAIKRTIEISTNVLETRVWLLLACPGEAGFGGELGALSYKEQKAPRELSVVKEKEKRGLEEEKREKEEALPAFRSGKSVGLGAAGSRISDGTRCLPPSPGAVPSGAPLSGPLTVLMTRFLPCSIAWHWFPLSCLALHAHFRAVTGPGLDHSAPFWRLGIGSQAWLGVEMGCSST